MSIIYAEFLNVVGVAGSACTIFLCLLKAMNLHCILFYCKIGLVNFCEKIWQLKSARAKNLTFWNYVHMQNRFYYKLPSTLKLAKGDGQCM
jgi:hypothetical protein